MKQLIQKHKGEIILSIVILIVIGLVSNIVITNAREEMSKELQKKEQELQEAKKLSRVEVLERQLQVSTEATSHYTTQKEEIEQKWKESIWQSRCIEENILLHVRGQELNDCSQNLEQWAIYNVK